LLDEMLGQVIKAFVVCRVGITASFVQLVALCNEELRVMLYGAEVRCSFVRIA